LNQALCGAGDVERRDLTLERQGFALRQRPALHITRRCTECRAFLARRRGRRKPENDWKLDGRAGGLKMDWTKPLHDARPMCFDCHLDARGGLQGKMGRVGATRDAGCRSPDGAAGWLPGFRRMVSVCCWRISLTRVATLCPLAWLGEAGRQFGRGLESGHELSLIAVCRLGWGGRIAIDTM
jgi:hypothetical protein